MSKRSPYLLIPLPDSLKVTWTFFGFEPTLLIICCEQFLHRFSKVLKYFSCCSKFVQLTLSSICLINYIKYIMYINCIRQRREIRLTKIVVIHKRLKINLDLNNVVQKMSLQFQLSLNCKKPGLAKDMICPSLNVFFVFQK